MNFRYKLMRFLSGRYGVDELFYIIFGLASILAITNCFVRSLVLQKVVYALTTYAIFRFFSRNISARQRENKFAAKLKVGIQYKMGIRRQRKADYTHVYKKCPRCHAVLRLPRKKGKHTTICPKCQNRFKVYVFKA